MKRVRLAFLWHMHQPPYREPETGDVLLPWVRLHATRAYHDMAWILERHPRVRCTVNFTPILLEQLGDQARGAVHDRLLDLTARPPADLLPEERARLLRMSFMVDWETNVRPLPRYWELLQKRGREPDGVDFPRLAASFSDQELTDLQVLFNLAWMGFGAEADEEVVPALRQKGRDYTRADVDALLAAQARIVAGVLPRWRRLAERGQVELSTTPYYHPILPLLCDTDAARRALPGIPLPPRFAHPEDARWQVRAALEEHARWFGQRPSGTWPAEGSVSPEALEVLASEGLRWAASDEGVLMRSLPPGTSRLRAVYRPWRVSAGRAGEMAMLFRDRAISDAIGFTYQKASARDATRDFVAHVAGVGEAWAADGRHGPATVGVFLDGENAWEHYPRSGHDFLDRLYCALEASDRIETVTMSEAVREAGGQPIPRVHSGSWIEASYRIWIGHEEDRQAWSALGQAREAVARAEAAGRVPSERLERAWRHLYAAEASDWYWWYGDDFATELAGEFDALFRGHVIGAALLAGAEPPPQALAPIKKAAAAPVLEARPLREPTVFVTPTLDGRVTDYFEWSGTGLLRPDPHRGAMYGGAQALGVLHYGFDLESLYLRIDPAESPARTAELASHLRVSLLAAGRPTWVDFPLVPDGVARPGRGRDGEVGRVAFAEVVELAVPFSAAGLVPGDRLGVAVLALRADVDVERLPRQGRLVLTVPDRDFERLNWRV